MFYVFYPVHFLVLYGVSMWIAKGVFFKIMIFDTHAHYDDEAFDEGTGRNFWYRFGEKKPAWVRLCNVAASLGELPKYPEAG